MNLVGVQCLLAISSFSVGRKLKQQNAAERRGVLLQQPISGTGQAAAAASSSKLAPSLWFLIHCSTSLLLWVLIQSWRVEYWRWEAGLGDYCKASLSLSECHSPGTHRPTPDQSSSLFTAHNVESKNEDLHPLPPWLSEFYVHKLDQKVYILYSHIPKSSIDVLLGGSNEKQCVWCCKSHKGSKSLKES